MRSKGGGRADTAEGKQLARLQRFAYEITAVLKVHRHAREGTTDRWLQNVVQELLDVMDDRAKLREQLAESHRKIEDLLAHQERVEHERRRERQHQALVAGGVVGQVLDNTNPTSFVAMGDMSTRSTTAAPTPSATTASRSAVAWVPDQTPLPPVPVGVRLASASAEAAPLPDLRGPGLRGLLREGAGVPGRREGVGVQLLLHRGDHRAPTSDGNAEGQQWDSVVRPVGGGFDAP
eukprot:CAMPEP_0204496156 /NCGR_PEP_ID=MMETSP0471-20130131/88121_1 /ASSEMBLY_ACC=CAM_ASM_000602 /TAXON_ID=2969 /ORGANISM="Oxyrrhis marina" /LENGTH=234 /DNA_ID=CAMNT_0051500483 /DNA_START=39 /DNA_END=738 /DNA_ORIENTATION=+